MDLDQLIVTVFCQIDDAMKTCLNNQNLRQRGPQPMLCDSEVLTMEVVGSFLGISQDKALFVYFRHHFSHFFPTIRRIHRTTFVRQAANLWKLKERLWQHIAQQVPHDPGFSLVDSFPLPVCRFARAYRCKRFQGQAGFGKDQVARQTFFGFRVHVQVAWPGVLVRFDVAPGNEQELSVVPELTDGYCGDLLGDRNFWSPRLKQELALHGIRLLAPFRSKKHDPHPATSGLMSRLRYRIDTIFGQLCQRFSVREVWAKDDWHLWGRLLRAFLSHTLMIHINREAGNEPLQLERLVTA